MNPVISVNHLKKYFPVAQKGEGFAASLVSLVKRTYKIVKAVDNVSFAINEGEMVAFLGPNGAGKTTTLKMLSGILYPTSGHIRVLDFVPQERKVAFQKQITLVMGQKNQLWWDLPPTDTFLLNKDIYKIPTHEYKQTLDELIELLEIQDILLTPVRKLSLGQRMKCEIIASVLHRPKVVFLDEPTIGLDIVMQKKIRNFIKEYNKKYNATVILTSHYMDDVKEICDRVIMIDHGHLIYDNSIKELISTYAKDKYLVVDFESEVAKKDIETIGHVTQYTGLSATIEVPREKHAQLASKLLEKFPVINIDITEVELEHIILKYFTKPS